MNATRIILAGALLTSGYAVYAKPAAHSPAPTAAELVAARQAGMDMSASSLTLLKNASTNGVPLKNLAFPAGGLAKWAAALPTLFADSTKGAKSDAKAEVFTDRAGFNAKAKVFVDATKALAAAAAAPMTNPPLRPRLPALARHARAATMPTRCRLRPSRAERCRNDDQELT